MIHINQPATWLGRTVVYCTTCKCRRRFIAKLYEWYPTEWLCGRCGYLFASGEGRHQAGVKERQRRRQYVKDTWKNVGRFHDVVRRMCDEIRRGTQTEKGNRK